MAQFPTILAERYRLFVDTGFLQRAAQYRELAASGQSPEIMIISCADSRVQPEIIFASAPGEIFAVRNVANLVPPYETTGKYHGVSAAIEFAVLDLKVKHIVVLGHSGCGGIRACLHERPQRQFLTAWMSLLDEARDRLTGDNLPDQLEREGIKASLANLRTFPYVAEAEQAGTLALHGAHFDIAQGALTVLDTDADRFVPLATAGAGATRTTGSISG